MTYKEELIKNANLMVAKGKGILAADESIPRAQSDLWLLELIQLRKNVTNIEICF